MNRRESILKYGSKKKDANKEWTNYPNLTEEQLKQAIINNPEDELALSAYADWLQENGKPHIGEMIQKHLSDTNSKDRRGTTLVEKRHFSPGTNISYGTINRSVGRDLVVSRIPISDTHHMRLSAWMPREDSKRLVSGLEYEGIPFWSREQHAAMGDEGNYDKFTSNKMEYSSSRRGSVIRYAAPFGVPAKELITEHPGRADWMTWKKYPGSTTKMSQNVQVNKNLLPVLAGSRLAVVLHEIRDRIGEFDPQLRKLAQLGLKGITSIKGSDLFTAIRNRLLSLSPGGTTEMVGGKDAVTNPRSKHADRAKQIAEGYNWHRVGAGLNVDEAVAEYVNKIAKQHLKDRGEQFRSAHNLFGIGSDSRNKASSNSHSAFWNGLRGHVKQVAVGPNSIYGLKGADISDKMLLRSLRRLAENEEQVAHIGTNRDISPTTKLPENPTYAPSGKAWSPSKAKGDAEGVRSGIRVTPTARANQFSRRRDVVRYGIFGTRIEQRPTVGIRHSSHNNGRYDENSHINALMEQNGVKHALTALGYDPQHLPNFLNRLRNYTQSNMSDPDVDHYLREANKLITPDEYRDEANRISLDEPNHPMSILGLSTAVAPLVKRIAEQQGIQSNISKPTPKPDYSLPPSPGEEPYADDLIDLSDPATAEDFAHHVLRDAEEIPDDELPQSNMPRFGSGSTTPIHPLENSAVQSSDLDFELPKVEGRLTPLPRQPMAPLSNPQEAHQDIANHLANRGTRESAIQMLQDKHGLDKRSASHHFEKYLKMKDKPRGIKQVENNPMSGGIGKGIRRKKTFMEERRESVLRYAIPMPTKPGKKVPIAPKKRRLDYDDETGLFQLPIQINPNAFRQGEANYRERIKQHAMKQVIPHNQRFVDFMEGNLRHDRAHTLLSNFAAQAIHQHLSNPNPENTYHFNYLLPNGKNKRIRINVRGNSPRVEDYRSKDSVSLTPKADTSKHDKEFAPSKHNRRLSIVRYARASDPEQHDQFMKGIVKDGYMSDATGLGPFADFLEEQGLPGANLAREAYFNSQDPENMNPPFQLGQWWDHGRGQNTDFMDEDGNTFAGAAPNQHVTINARINHGLKEGALSVIHAPQGHYDSPYGYLYYSVPIRSREHLHKLTADLPEPQKQKIHEFMLPHLKSESPNQLSRILSLRKYGAYRAPAGGIIVRGSHYKGGKMIPDMKSDFMNPPQKLGEPTKFAEGDSGGATTEEDFQKMLDANPNDHQTRMILADYLDDVGDPRAAGYRALGIRKRNSEKDESMYPFWWYAHDYHSINNHEESSLLPRDWMEHIVNIRGEGRDSDLENHPTRKDADDTAALAFSKLLPERQQELLGLRNEKLSRRLSLKKYQEDSESGDFPPSGFGATAPEKITVPDTEFVGGSKKFKFDLGKIKKLREQMKLHNTRNSS